MAASDQNTPDKSAAEVAEAAKKAQKEHEKLLKENTTEMKDAIGKAMDIKESKDGKSRWMGMEVDPKFGSLIRAGQAWLVPRLNKFAAPTVGKMFEAGARSLRADEATAKTANTVGQSAFLWSTVFFQQIADMASNTRDYTQQRNELFKQFKPIAEASGAQVSVNEVMRTEYERAGKAFSASVKGMAGDVVTLVPNVIIAAQQQNALLNKQPFSFGKKVAAEPKDNRSPEQLRQDIIRKEVDRRLMGLDSDHIDDAYRTKIAREVAQEINVGKVSESANGGATKNDEKLMSDVLTYTAFASPVVNSFFKTEADKSPSAWEMIKKAKSEIDAVCSRKGNECEFTAPDVKRIRIDNKPLPDYLVDIFQQNEKNRGRSEIAGVNLERLQEASVAISEALAKGLIDANALVLLVGEHKVIEHKAGTTSIVQEEELQASIDQLSTRLGKKMELSSDEFYKAFANPEAIRTQVKQDIESMEGLEKACFVTLIPENVAKNAGLSEAAIREARIQARDHMYGIVDTYMHKLQEVVEQAKPADLHEMGLTKKNVKSLKRFVDAMDSDQKDQALQSVVDGHQKEMLTVMASVMLNQEHDDKDGMRKDWTKLVKQSATKDEIIKQEKPEDKSHADTEEKKVSRKESREEADIEEREGDSEETSHSSKVGKSSSTPVKRDRLARQEASNGMGIGGV